MSSAGRSRDRAFTPETAGSIRAINRRDLLCGVAAGSAVPVVLGGIAAPHEEVPPAPPDHRTVRYRVTEHISSFYRRARF